MVLLLIMVVTPLLAMGENAAQFRTASLLEIPADEGQKGQAGESGTMKVLRASSNRVETMSDLEYVIGAVSAKAANLPYGSAQSAGGCRYTICAAQPQPSS